MIYSMTGYGKAECNTQSKKVTIEVKSLNSKNADINTKIPGLYREKELEVRNFLTNELQRGKIELSLYYETKEDYQSGQINPAIVKNYFYQLRNIAEELQIPTEELTLQSVMRLPDVYSQEREDLDPEEWKLINQTISLATEELKRFRQQEGKHLENDIKQRIDAILGYIPSLEELEKPRMKRVRERLEAHIKEYINNKEFDQNRLEQELIYYIEKYDITEEKVRLENHCNYFKKVMKNEEPVGKKLGFIAQEIGREINTLGSKANDSDMQQIVVRMKDELEKIKEQILNIL